MLSEHWPLVDKIVSAVTNSDSVSTDSTKQRIELYLSSLSPYEVLTQSFYLIE